MNDTKCKQRVRMCHVKRGHAQARAKEFDERLMVCDVVRSGIGCDAEASANCGSRCRLGSGLRCGSQGEYWWWVAGPYLILDMQRSIGHAQVLCHCGTWLCGHTQLG